MKEIWKETKYEGYMVSNLGRVKSLNKQKGFLFFEELFMKLTPHKKRGYIFLSFVVDGKKTPVQVHRLVAEAFIPNPKNLETVNHIDEVKTNNRVDNLEWMSFGDNSRYSNFSKKSKKAKKVKQFDRNMNLIKQWDCLRDIERELDINHGVVNYYANKGTLDKTNGYYWMW